MINKQYLYPLSWSVHALLFSVKTLVDEKVTAGIQMRKTQREYFLLDTLIIIYREYLGDKDDIHESL